MSEDKTNYEELTKFNLKAVKAVMNNFEDRLCDDMQERVEQIEKYLENLILRNKELEEKQKKLKQKNIDIEYKNLLYELYYIPKSKIKEKIEELDKEEKEAQDSISDEEREEYSDASIGYLLMDIETRREVLQELLEENKNE